MVASRSFALCLCFGLLVVAFTPRSLIAQCPPLDLTCGSGVAVTPDGGTVTARYVNSGPFTQTFALTNTGAQPLSLTVNCGFSRGSCSVVGSASVSLSGFQTKQKSVSFTTGSSGGSGTLTLTASGSGVSDQGRVTVPVIEPAIQITGPDAVTVPTGSRSLQSVFWVQNMGNRVETWSFSCRPTAPVVCGTAQPSSAQLQPGVVPTQVTVTYDVADDVGAGAVRLRATHSGTGLVRETAAVVRVERYAVAVSAAPPPAERIARSVGHAQAFYVTNVGSISAPYSWTCVPSANVVCRGTTPGSATIAPGQTVNVTAQYDVTDAGTGSIGLTASGVYASASRSISFPVNAYAVSVSVIGGQATHVLGSGPHSRAFLVTNQSSVAAPFYLRCAAGGVAACENNELGPITIGPAADSTVGVPYRITSTGSGWVELTANSASGGGFSDSDRLDVVVTAPPVTVVADSTNLVPKPVGTGPYAATFRVTNGAPNAVLFDFECFGAGGLSCQGDPPVVEIGGFGDTRIVTALYAAGPTPSLGTVTLRARSRTNPVDSASAQVTARAERFGVMLSPADTAVARLDGRTHTDAFTIVNTGSIRARYDVECSASGELDCLNVQETVTLDPSESVALPVEYRTGSISSGNALIVAATHADWREISADGRYLISIVDAGVTVSSPKSVGVAPGSVTSHRFTVRKVGSGFAQLDIVASCTGPVFAGACSASTSSLGLGSGQEESITVTFRAAEQLDRQGTLVVRAVPTQDPSAADSATVGVSTGSAMPLTISTAAAASPDRRDRSLCLTASVGPAAASECGVLRVTHALPSVRTMNRERTPVMLYNSDLAHPNPVVAAEVGVPIGGLTPDSVRGRLVVDGVQRDARTWDGTEWGPGRAARVAMSFDGFALNTGVYPYDLELIAFAGGATMTTTTSGEVAVINRKQSRYGAGWWLAGLEQLWFLRGGGDRILWVAGDGSWTIYERAGGAPDRWVAPGATRPDTLWYEAGSERYVRRLPGRVEVRFDGQGRHVETRNRLGHVTRFVYEGDPRNQHRERVSEIRVPTPSGGSLVAYRFEYGDGLTQDGNPNNDRLDRVYTLPDRPEGQTTRTVRTRANQNGARLRQFVDPGGRRVRFGYHGAPNQHRMRWREDGLGFRTSYEYDPAGRVVAAQRQAGPGQSPVRLALRPGETIGLAVPIDTADAYAQVDGPRTDVSDVTRYWLDPFGAPRRVVDAVGGQIRIGRSDPRFPAAVTLVEGVNGFVTRAFHDSRGNVDSTVSVRPAGRAVTRYTWDPQFDFASRAVSPEGERTETDYDPATGNRRWVQKAGDPASRVVFRYSPDGLLRAVDPPLAPADSLAYDALGNLRLTVSAAGFRKNIYRDAFGRDTLIVSPIDTAQTAMTRRRLTYDAAGRVVREVTAADAVRFTHLPEAPTLPAESTIVRTEYDAEGRVTRVVRYSVPDSNEIDSIVTAWRYDALGRAVAEVAPDGAVDSTVYDPAGNVLETHTRRGYVLTASYDALNRVRERVTPPVDYDDFRWVVPGEEWRFPLFRTGATLIPADTTRFAYDGAGNIVQADNRDARVSRQYNADGTLAEEISRIRSFNGNDWGMHVYRQSYGYDRAGRRVWHAHPSQLAPRVAGQPQDTVHYRYDGFGRLDTVRTVFEDLTFRYAYDDAGRLREARSPGGIREERQYDAGGRMRYRAVGGPGNWLVHDSLTFDATGRILAARGIDGRHDTRMGYAGLGALVRSYETMNDWVGTGWTSQTEERYSADALGNRRSSFRSSLTVPSTPSEETTDYVYERGTGRLLQQVKRAGLHWPNPSNDSVGLLVTTTEYDETGNMRVETTLGPADAPAVLRRSEFYYGADDRLRIVDKRSCYVEPVLNGPPQGDVGCNTQTRLAFGDRWAYEEYRYDAFGRRVLTRSWEEFCAGMGCARSLQRTVWDGNQVLYEIRYPGLSEQDAGVIDLGDSIPGPPTCSPGCDTYEPQEIFPYGVIGYVHAAGVDEPLMAMRMFYGPQRSAPFAVVPHGNWRGAYVTGTDGGGAPLGDCSAAAPSCVAISWPAARQFTGFKPRGFAEDGPPAWMGSLLGGKRDATGQLYMRNRYYDPETGRFTQEDPIGLAGGLNLYGFAGGDPVNYRDPFGLSDCTIRNWRECTLFKATFGLGFKGFGTEGTLGPLSIGLRILSAGADVNATGTPEGVEGDVDASLTLISGEASVNNAAARGSVSCSADSEGAACDASGSLGLDGAGVKTSNTSVGGSISIGFVKAGLKVDLLQAGTALLGATSDLLVGAARFAYDQVLGRPNQLPPIGPAHIGGLR